MRFDLSPLNPVYVHRQPTVGNVYAARGGPKTAPRFWVILSIVDTSCKMAGIDQSGSICSVASYYTSAVERMPLVGWVPDIIDLKFDIRPIPS